MAKVYISFLGTTPYTPCIYYREPDRRESTQVRFFQQAALELYCQDWTKGDRIYVFTTDKAYETNWLDGITEVGEGVSVVAPGLGELLKEMKPECDPKHIDIPPGESEDQIWKIFESILNVLTEGDEVLFDITHAFRSIPSLAVVVLNYAKLIKKIKVIGIYYGAFEAKKEGKAPIFNLASFDTLLEWTAAINQFNEAGDAQKVYDLAGKTAAPIKAKINEVANCLKYFTKAMSTCRGLDISPSALALKKSLDDYTDVNHFLPLKPLLEIVRKQVDVFTGHTLRDGIQAAKWCFDHNLVQQGFTILAEILVTHLVEEVGGDTKNWHTRKFVGNAATSLACEAGKKIPASKGKKKIKQAKPKTPEDIMMEKQCNICPTYTDVLNTVKELKDDRNDLDHAGYRDQPKPPEYFEQHKDIWLKKIIANLSKT
ncbi:MAG: TIGR02221 family CRISPR-associated protein [Deltaproteobacteria bacterium]|nr:TIGR02221 family CRISPR-associated protein [Deltaproteobacteria bacterium]